MKRLLLTKAYVKRSWSAARSRDILPEIIANMLKC